MTNDNKNDDFEIINKEDFVVKNKDISKIKIDDYYYQSYSNTEETTNSKTLKDSSFQSEYDAIFNKDSNNNIINDFIPFDSEFLNKDESFELKVEEDNHDFINQIQSHYLHLKQYLSYNKYAFKFK